MKPLRGLFYYLFFVRDVKMVGLTVMGVAMVGGLIGVVLLGGILCQVDLQRAVSLWAKSGGYKDPCLGKVIIIAFPFLLLASFFLAYLPSLIISLKVGPYIQLEVRRLYQSLREQSDIRKQAAELGPRTWAEPSAHPAPPAESHRQAQRHKYISRVWVLAAWAAMFGAIYKWKPTFLEVVGQSPDWSTWVMSGWVVTTFLVGDATCGITAAVTYYRYTGKAYGQDKSGLVNAGGYAIARWALVIAFLGVFGVYWVTFRKFSSDPIAFIRNPWLFTFVSSAVAHVLTWVAARIAYLAKLGEPARVIRDYTEV